MIRAGIVLLSSDGIAAALEAAPDPLWLLDGWMQTPVVFDELV